MNALYGSNCIFRHSHRVASLVKYCPIYNNFKHLKCDNYNFKRFAFKQSKLTCLLKWTNRLSEFARMFLNGTGIRIWRDLKLPIDLLILIKVILYKHSTPYPNRSL